MSDQAVAVTAFLFVVFVMLLLVGVEVLVRYVRRRTRRR